MKHVGVLESNLSGSGFEGLRMAKELGHRVTFFTRNLDRYLAIPGGPRYFDEYVDEIVYCETNEVEPVLRQVRTIEPFHPFAGFLTLGDYDVVVAALVATELGLPTPDPAGVRTARNKALMRTRCAEHGVPMPGFRRVSSPERAAGAVAELGLPCVVKPADENSGSDVLRCADVAEVVEQVGSILAKTHNTRGQPRHREVLVEECALGFEVSVEVLAMGGAFHVFGVTDKAVGGHNRFVELGHAFPSMLDATISGECAAVATAALRAVGFDLGMAHVEIKYTAAGPRLIEINPRPAGGKITDLIDLTTGTRCLELVVRQYLGEHVADDLPGRPARGAAIRYLTADPGTVRAVTGLPTAAAMPGVHEAVVSVGPGQTVGPLLRNHDRVGHVLAVAKDAYLASRLADAAAHEIAVLTGPTTSGPVASGPVASGLVASAAAGGAP